MSLQRTWVVVLAAGEGSRLARLTTDARGRAVPKQYCSLSGGEPLILETERRALGIAPIERTCAIVAMQHRRYWQALPWRMPRGNLIVQPHNRGTAHGILLSILSVLARDPLAQIVFLPADHYIRDEQRLATSLRQLAALIARSPQSLALLGIAPEQADPELGYILPGPVLPDGSRSVERFLEKPAPHVARTLIGAGALWNSFIFGGCGVALLGLLSRGLGETAEAMATALARDTIAGGRSHVLSELYEALPTIDFSRAVMQGAESVLRVVTAPACGWSDLGTPDRVAETLRRLRLPAGDRRSNSTLLHIAGRINLAAQHARLGLAG